MTAPPIRSHGLDLVSMSSLFVSALLGGERDEAEQLLGARLPEDWPDDHDARFLRLRLEQMRDDPEVEEWLVRAVVLRPDARVVGHAGFHGPPGVNALEKPGFIEIGYTVFAPFRGRGYATEAALALMGWAGARGGVEGFVASVAPENEPSLAIVRKLGFVPVGERWDQEDGLELVWELRGAPPLRAPL